MPAVVPDLDRYKAFDSVWHTGLLYKLADIEMPLKYDSYCTDYTTTPNHFFFLIINVYIISDNIEGFLKVAYFLQNFTFYI